MIRRLILVVFALMFVTACNALDHDNTPFEGFSERDVPFNPFLAASPYEGDYSGTITLQSIEEGCPCDEGVVGEERPITLNVVQANEYINILFEDEVEANGKLVETKVTVVKKGMNDTRMFNLDFAGEGVIEGACDCHQGVGDNTSVEPCAKYEMSLSKSE